MSGDRPGVPRRRFLAGAAGVAVVAVTTSRSATVAALAKAPAPPDPLTRSAWTALVGQAATLAGPTNKARATIVEVTPAPSAAGADQERCFSIVLQATDRVHAPGAIHRVKAGGLTADLFVSPVDRGKRGRWYQIVVNSPSR